MRPKGRMLCSLSKDAYESESKEGRGGGPESANKGHPGGVVEKERGSKEERTSHDNERNDVPGRRMVWW